MSNTRIRYDQDGVVLESRRVFQTSTGLSVKAKLNLLDKKFEIINANTGEVLTAGGNTKNKSVLKIQAKRALTELGVNFEAESRNRG